jgi:hypothetical protein
MSYVCAAFAPLLLAIALSGSAQTNGNETVGRFLVSLPLRHMDPVIDYCGENDPEMKSDLLKERAGFFERMTAAGISLEERHKNDPEFNAPADEWFRREVTEAHLHGLTLLKQQDPDVICPNILANMRDGTVDEIRNVLGDTYEKYRPAEKFRKRKE